jgi:hypothetical protein
MTIREYSPDLLVRDVVQSCGKRPCVFDAPRWLHAPSIAFQIPCTAPL